MIGDIENAEGERRTELPVNLQEDPHLKLLYESLGRATYRYALLSHEIEQLEQGINSIRNKILELET